MLYASDMSTAVLELEKAVQRLDPADLKVFRDWFLAFEADQWDRQIEIDIRAGRLDSLAEEARREAREGKVTDL